MKKTKVLQFYLDNIKLHSDRIPYFRELAKIVWNIIWKLRLALKSIWFSVDFMKIYWIDPQKIIYGLERDYLFFIEEHKTQEKKLFKIGKQDWYIIKFEEKIVYQSFYQHFIMGKQWKETNLYIKLSNKTKGGKKFWRYSSINDFYNRCKMFDKLYDDIKHNDIKTQRELKKNSLLKEN